MRNIFRSIAAAAALCLLGASSPVLAGDAYFVLKSGEGGKTEFPVTSEVIAKAGEIEFKSALTDQDEDIHTVRGARLRDVLKIAGVTGKTVAAKAADDYEAEIPMSDVTDYDVIICTSVDGKPITADENGPSRILYPVIDNPKLKDNEDVAARSVFQLKELTVK